MDNNDNNDLDEELYSDNLSENYSENKRRTEKLANKAINATKTVGKKTKVWAKLSKNKVILAICGVSLLWIVLAIFLIGIIAYIMTGPFSLTGQIVKMADEVWTKIKTACVSVVSGDDYAQVTDEHVKTVAQYIENMGYSLKGYGFIGFPSGESVTDENGNIIQNSRKDELELLKRDSNNLISSIKSSLIVEYLAAENRTYMLSSVSLNSVYRWYKGLDLIGKDNLGDIANQGAENASLDTGMLNVNKEIDAISQARCAEDGFILDWDSIGNTSPNQTIYAGMEYNPGYDHYSNGGQSKILNVTPEVDRAKRQLKLKIEQEYYVNGIRKAPPAEEYIFNLDGWTGRYGKPIEFLLSLHLGTMSPGFAEAIATRKAFDTKVNIRIHKAVDVYIVRYQGMNMDECLKFLETQKNNIFEVMIFNYNAAVRARTKT